LVLSKNLITIDSEAKVLIDLYINQLDENEVFKIFLDEVEMSKKKQIN